MDFLIIFVLVIILLFGGVIFLSFWLPKKLGFPIAGKVIGSVVSCLLLYYIIVSYYEDELFSKEDAIELLEEQNFKLNDEFKIEENKSDWAIGDYYHILRLSISENDKQRLINQIQSSPDFKDTTNNVTELIYSQEKMPVGKKIFQNYETKNYYTREFYEENGGNYAPTFRKVSIDKNKNELKFEDIDL